MSKSKSEWVVFGGKIGESCHCTRCGEGLTLGTLPVAVWVAATKAFAGLHRNCQPGRWTEPVPQNPYEWIRGRDTGVSSATIWSVMVGPASPYRQYQPPRDPDDFGRCYRLLKYFPAWLPRLGEVSQTYPQWKGLIDRWTDLTRLYEGQQFDEMYRLMQTLDSPAPPAAAAD